MVRPNANTKRTRGRNALTGVDRFPPGEASGSVSGETSEKDGGIGAGRKGVNAAKQQRLSRLA